MNVITILKTVNDWNTLREYEVSIAAQTVYLSHLKQIFTPHISSNEHNEHNIHVWYPAVLCDVKSDVRLFSQHKIYWLNQSFPFIRNS
jgi:hypothetical protein